MNALEVEETTILQIVPDGIVDEVNHYINSVFFQTTIYLMVDLDFQGMGNWSYNPIYGSYNPIYNW